MSGTWLDRANARQPLKDSDVAAGLRDLAAAVQDLAQRGGAQAAAHAELAEQVAALAAPKDEAEPAPRRSRSS